MQLTIVDVFAEKLYEGNQLAVIEGAGSLDTVRMQAIAREMNFSETTFVCAVADDRADVRIFTPAEELPFAGHPTLGTAWVLGRDRSRFALSLPGGVVPVSFIDGVCWMTPPPPELKSEVERKLAASLIGLQAGDLDAEWSPRVVHSGADYALVPVKSLAELQRIRIDGDALRAFDGASAVFAVCRRGYSADADFAARMHFFDGSGFREDPATGSANSGFARFLGDIGLDGDFVVEQGFEIGRPSRIYLRTGAALQVGGRVQLVAEGTLA